MKNKKGSVLILGLLLMAILLLFGGVFLSLTLINYNTISVSSDMLKAQWIAYAGIKKIAWELKDNYSNVEFQSRTEDFGAGTYNTVTTSLKSGGVHDILAVSKGNYNNAKEVLIARFQLDTPSDYLYFFDGNGEIGNSDNSNNIYLGGPIHSNSNLTFTTYNNYIYVVKPVILSGGPVVSSAGLIVRTAAYDPAADRNWNKKDVLIGEGTPFFDKDYNYTGDVPTNNLDYYRWGMMLLRGVLPTDDFPNDFTDSDWAKSTTNPSPDQTFPTLNTPLGVLNDGFHNGYYIKIPTIRNIEPNKKYPPSTYANLPFMNDSDWQKKIRELYEAYIDENYYIRGEEIIDNYANKYYRINNAGIFRKKSFTNDSYRTKLILGIGNGSNREFTLLSYYPVGKENIAKQNSSGSLTSFNFYPARRRIKNIYINETNMNILPGYTFTAYYKNDTNIRDQDVPTRSRIAFDFSPLTNKKNIQVVFSNDVPFRIGEGNGTQTTFEYYPGTISKVYIYDYSGYWNETSAYTLLNADHSSSATTLTSTNPGNTIFQSPDTSKQNFAKLFKSDILEIYDNLGSKIYDRSTDPVPTSSSPVNGIINIDYVNGVVTFNTLQTSPISAKYIARAIRFNTPPSASPPVLSGDFPNIGIRYSTPITIGEGYNSNFSRSFSFPHQDEKNNKIQRVIVDGIDAYCIVANYLNYYGDPFPLYGSIIFSSPPPSNADISTDLVRQIYLINNKEPKVNNIYWDTTRKDDIPPLITHNGYVSPDGIYRWWDYQSIDNRIIFYNSGASETGWGYPVYLPDPDPTPITGALVCVDQVVNAVDIDLDSINIPPKKGIIFSEVPVIVRGTAKFPVTIVCLADVYLQSINKDLPDDSGNAYPVGVISARGVWMDFSELYKSDINHFSNIYYDLLINKVAVYTTRGIFYHGGRIAYNRLKFFGSICSMDNSFGRRATEGDFSADYIDFDHNFNQYNYGKYILMYANSFRNDIENYSGFQGPPPHMPIYLQQLYFKSASINNVDRFMDNIKEYISNKRKIPKEIYLQFLKELEG